jgi:hypothetical protein
LVGLSQCFFSVTARGDIAGNALDSYRLAFASRQPATNFQGEEIAALPDHVDFIIRTFFAGEFPLRHQPRAFS